MRSRQVAAQLYTVREHLKTAAEIAASLKKVKQIGYGAVELASAGAVGVDELAKMLGDAGLTCVASHEGSSSILSEPAAVAARAKKLGAKYAVFPHPGGVRLETLADVQSLAQGLNSAGKVLSEAGVILAYHNHSVEFRRFDGRLMLEALYAETDPRYVQAELDTYWVQHGGGDSEDWCRCLSGRLPLLHLKDYMISAEGRPTFAEIGRGNLNWKPIIAAAEESGCQWYVVEQDTCPGDPFDSLKISFEFIRDHLCS
jgi:sugar phosphate isomerase/epimerase